MKEFFDRFMPLIVTLVLGTFLAGWLVPIELEQMQWEVPGMPSTYPIEQMCRPVFLGLLCYMPFIGAVGYSFMGTMDRYVSRNFISYFMMCTLILLLIYILADFTDNMERFRTRFDDPVVQALRFYGSQLPMFLYQILPYTIMMGTMWCLSKLSGTCEITGMMQSGRSLLRLCMPVFYFSIIAAMVYGIFGFHWAPNGSLYREMILKRKQTGVPASLIYKSEEYSRIWRVGIPSPFTNPGAPMRNLVIEQFDENSALKRQYIAERATWDRQASTWALENVYVRDIAPVNVRPEDEKFSERMVCDFAEKPYQIISPGHNGRIDAMGTSALYEYLKSGAGTKEDRAKKRTEWHVRIAKVFSCLVLVLLAIPSSVTFQRRGTMKGIGIAVILAAFQLFLYRVFPALGEAGVMPAWVSAWIPNVMYFIIAVWIFRRNLAHRSFAEWAAAKMKGEA